MPLVLSDQARVELTISPVSVSALLPQQGDTATEEVPGREAYTLAFHFTFLSGPRQFDAPGPVPLRSITGATLCLTAFFSPECIPDRSTC